MIGIYKITSPTKKVYIGQSVDIEKRLYNYKILNCKGQTAIYRSLLKYGIDKHKFEVLCECNVEELNDKERYYQDVFSVMDKNGLNCKLTKSSDRNGILSEETKLKIGLAHKGKKKHSDESKKKISEANKGNKHTLGRKHSDESRKKIRDFQYNLPDHMKIARELKKIKTQQKRKNKQKKMQADYVHSLKKVILNTQTGVFYYSVVEAANSINMNKHSLGGKLRGYDKVNKTPFIYA
jgi:group I intron endonuclease